MVYLAQQPWLLFPLALLLSAGLACLLIPFAHRIGWVDHPGGRKVHEQSTPVAGGAVVYLALVTTLLFSPSITGFDDLFYPALLTGAGLLLLIGLADDLRDLSFVLRFVFQVVVCFGISQYAGLRLTDFGPLFSSEVQELGALSLPITLFAALGVINSFNLVDGLDGLAGALFLVAATFLAIFASAAGNLSFFWFLLVSMGSVLGFLLFNARLPWNTRAKVFLGDAGSLMLGFILAWSFIRMGSGPERAFLPMTAVWLFAVPLLDTSTCIWRRWREGRSAFAADQNHLHHAFLRAGFSVGQTAAAITLLAVALAGLGALIEWSGVPAFLSFYAFMALAFAYYFYIKHCWAVQRFLGRHFLHQVVAAE